MLFSHGQGQTGPAATKAGHDLVCLAMGGGLAHRGQMRQPPSRAFLSIADVTGGSFAALAILAALREGQGKVLDLSLYESVLYTSAIRFGIETPVGSPDRLYPANDLLQCGDGRQIALTVTEEKFRDNPVMSPAISHQRLAGPISSQNRCVPKMRWP